MEQLGGLVVSSALVGEIDDSAGVFIAVEPARLKPGQVQVGFRPGVQYVADPVSPGAALHGKRAHRQADWHGDEQHRADDQPVAAAASPQGDDLLIAMQPAQGHDYGDVQSDGHQDLEGDEGLQQNQLEHEVDAQGFRNGFRQVAGAAETGEQGNQDDEDEAEGLEGFEDDVSFNA